MRRYLILVLYIGVSLSGLPGQDQSRPRLGLALSGGGAKGLAHIGVLKVLEEAGIQPDYLTGTSMGSIVGGLYAIGYSARDLDSLAHVVSWADLFNDQPSRLSLPIEEKWRGERYQLGVPWQDGRILLPKGFVNGTNISLLLARLTMPVHNQADFSKFPIPFCSIATDLESGHAVVFTQGSLADAIRASVAIPTVFEPYEWEGKLLIDGGVARNVPVEDALNLGADLVMAVDVGASLYKKEALNSVVNVLDQTSSFRIVESNRLQLEQADLVIRPDISGVSALDFEAVDSLIARGERAARAALPRLKALLGPDYPYRSSLRPSLRLPEAMDVQTLVWEVKGKSPNTEKLTRLLRLKLPQTLNLDDLQGRLKRLYASGLVAEVNYRIEDTYEGHRLVIRVKAPYRTLLQMGVHYDNDLRAAMLLNATWRNSLVKGGSFALDLRVSEYPVLLGTYQTYSSSRPNIGFRFRGRFQVQPGFYYESNQLIDQYSQQAVSFRASIFSGLSDTWRFSAGGAVRWQTQSGKFFGQGPNGASFARQDLWVSLDHDKLNRKYFPTQGARFELAAEYAVGGQLSLGGMEDSTSSLRGSTGLRLQYEQSFSLHPQLTLRPYLRAGWLRLRTTNLINLFYLGRATPYDPHYIEVTGLGFMEQAVDRFALAGLCLQLEPWPRVFVSTSFNYTYAAHEAFLFVSSDGLRLREARAFKLPGIGLELGLLSNRFGPIRLGSEFNPQSRDFNFVVQIGYIF